jgi:hypothetical protein
VAKSSQFLFYFSGRSFLLLQRDSLVTRLMNLLPKDNKNVQVAMATVILNIAVACCETGPSDSKGVSTVLAEAQVQCVTTIGMLLLEALTDVEARFRTLVALGTLLETGVVSSECANLAKEFRCKLAVERWRDEAGGSKKTIECANFLLAILM